MKKFIVKAKRFRVVNRNFGYFIKTKFLFFTEEILIK